MTMMRDLLDFLAALIYSGAPDDWTEDEIGPGPEHEWSAPDPAIDDERARRCTAADRR